VGRSMANERARDLRKNQTGGGQHNVEPGRAADESRDARLRGRGYTVLRFWNHDVLQNPDGVLEEIARTLRLASGA